MELEAFVTTPEIGSVGDISLENPGTYRVMEWGPGQIAWRREEVSSPYVHGSTLVGAVKETPVILLVILVEGMSSNDLMAKTAALLRAFEQFRYRLNISVDDEEYEWVCQPADYSSNNDGSFNRSHWAEFCQVYTFRIPRDPTPIEGTH